MLTRRTLIGAGLATGAMLTAGCGDEEDPDVGLTGERTTYGDDPSQYVELWRPEGDARGVVVVIHGGFWKAEYDLDLGRPLARDLVRRGWVTLNVEYRRVGNGGGVPETLDDVAAAIDTLRDIDGLDLSRVVTLGHSAGGHLATWAAARHRFDPWKDGVPVTAVVSQAGVLDLRGGLDAGLGTGAVEAFVGAPPGPSYAETYDLVDPTRQLPLDVPVWCVHGRDDDVVPLSQSADYVDAGDGGGSDGRAGRGRR